MRKLGLMCGVLAILLMVQGAYAVSGPGGRLYVWYDNGKVFSGKTDAVPDNRTLMSVAFTPSWDLVDGGHQVYTPVLEDHWYSPAESTGLACVYTRPANNGEYGQMLLGAYYNHTSGSTNDPTTSQVMDILRIAPHADNTYSLTLVHDGRKWTNNNAFHTQNAQQVLYDKNGTFTGSAYPSVITACIDAYLNDPGGKESHTVTGWASDVDGDGIFDDTGDGGATETGKTFSCYRYSDLALSDRYLVNTANYTGSQWYTNLRTTWDSPVGTDNYIQKLYYVDCVTMGGGLWGKGLAVNINTVQWVTIGPVIAAADTNHNGIADVYWTSTSFDHDNDPGTPAKPVLLHSEDLNQDGDVLNDPGETELVFTFGVNGEHVEEQTYWTYAATHLMLVPDNGSGLTWSLLMTLPGPYDRTEQLGVIGLGSDNGDWDGTSKYITYSEDTSGVHNLYLWKILNNADSHMFMPNEVSAIIPEPATLVLVGTGLIGLLGYIRRRRMK